MNSAVLITTPVLLTGGTELQTLALARALVEAGYAVTVCCYYEHDESIVQRFRTLGAEVHLMQYERAQGLWHLVNGLRKLFKAIKPDIVHVQYISPGLVPIMTARFAGVRTVFATVHQPGRVYGWKEKAFIILAARLSSAFFCNSRATEQSWFGESEVFDPLKININRKHFTIYNGIDVNNINETIRSSDQVRLRSSIGVSDNPLVGVVGRLRWEKGQSFLLDAMPELVTAVPETMLLVIGDGPDREYLKNKARDLNIDNNIIWLGQKSPEEVYGLYSIMDVVVVPSVFEGFGLVAAEAMAAGLPVVSCGVDGLNEIIEDGETGYLVPAENTARLAEAVTKLLDNKIHAKTMGEKGKEHIKNTFSIERYNNSIRASYNVFSTR